VNDYSDFINQKYFSSWKYPTSNPSSPSPKSSTITTYTPTETTACGAHGTTTKPQAYRFIRSQIPGLALAATAQQAAATPSI
jgi:hypothetical protein